MAKRKAALAFSGGLDTSFCVVYLREKLGYEVVTVAVDTGGFSKNELDGIRKRALDLGASKHYTVDGRQRVFDEFVTYLIKGNVLRGGVYPLSVGAERVVQAEEVSKIALKEKCDAVAHGSTGAGNDQVRFDTAFKVLVPDFKVLAPIRDLGWSRQKEADYLIAHGHAVKLETKKYSINAGLWGTTIGGGETHDSWLSPPDEAYTMTAPAYKAPEKPGVIQIGFEHGIPISLNGKKMGGLKIIEKLNTIGAIHGVGRGIHVGDTILGIKGRIAFESPAPQILITAHRELEKLVLTRWQQYWKDTISEFYGMLLHEAQHFDPVTDDLKAMIDSSQQFVSGTVKVRLYKGLISITGCKSQYSILAAQKSAYGEGSQLWSAQDAQGFCNIYGMPAALARMAKQRKTKKTGGQII